MAERARKEITPEMVVTMVEACEKGMSISGAGALVGLSTRTLDRRREEDDELDAALVAARARYEYKLTRLIDEMPGTTEAAIAAKERAQSFPTRHGDPRIRIRSDESRVEDMREVEQAPAGGLSLDEAVQALLAIKKASAQ